MHADFGRVRHRTIVSGRGMELDKETPGAQGAAEIEEAHPGVVDPEKRGRVKRVLRYVPVAYWFITVGEVLNHRAVEHSPNFDDEPG